jgi:hypothetical protein
MGFFQAARQFQTIIGSDVNFPSTHEARWLTEQTRYSPDLGWLEQFEYQWLFAADDTRVNHPHHTLVKDCEFGATAYTTKKFNYSVLETAQERIPIPLIATSDEHIVRHFPPPLKIRGELLKVRTYQFQGLDTYKRNNVQFKRKRITVIVPYRDGTYTTNVDEHGDLIKPIPRQLQGTRHFVMSKEKVYIIRAWMYVALPAYWDDILDAGWRGFKTVNYYESKRSWLKEYYDFPKQPLK